MEKQAQTVPSQAQNGNEAAYSAMMETLNNLEPSQEAKEPTAGDKAEAKTDTSKQEDAKESKETKETKDAKQSESEDVIEKLSVEPEEIKKAKEEAKVPLSRLNEVIQQKKALQKQVEKLEKRLVNEQQKDSELSEEELEEKRNLRKIGVKTRSDELEALLDEKQEELEELEDTIKETEKTVDEINQKALKSRITQLEKEYDGKNGLPKFDIKELLEFAERKRFFPDDPAELYTMKYQSEIFAAKYQRGKATSVEKSSGIAQSEVVPPKKRSWDNFDDEARKTLESLG